MADRATSAGPLQVLSNPLVTALLLTAIAMMVFFTLLDGKCLPDVGWRAKTKTAVYMFLGTVVVLGLHFHALERKVMREHHATASESLVSQLHQSQSLPEVMTGSDYVPITPGQQSRLGRPEPAPASASQTQAQPASPAPPDAPPPAAGPAASGGQAVVGSGEGYLQPTHPMHLAPVTGDLLE